MKILYYFRNLDSVMFQWQNYHIVNELKRHDIIIDILNPHDHKEMGHANDALIKILKDNKYDLFMTCLNEQYLYIETIKTIKKMGIPTLLFCLDNLVAPYLHKSVAKYFDLVWLTSYETEYLFKRWGCNTVFLPYAANPYFLQPNYNVSEIKSVGFIGTPHGSRIDRINTLLDAEVPVTVHTNIANLESKLLSAKPTAYIEKLYSLIHYPIGIKLATAAIIDKLWHRKLNDKHRCLEVKKAVPLNSLAETNCSYSLVLSFTDADSTGVLKNPVKIVNLRNFEIPMSGALQFTTYSNELAKYFEDGKEIILCKDKEEYVSKAKFYLQDKQAETRQKMRLAARKRAESEHTWLNRFNVVFEILGLLN